MSYPRRPRFLFGESEFVPSLPSPPWVPADMPTGVTRWTASGVPGPVLKRRDALITVPLRIREEEFVAFLAFLEWGQASQPIAWYPDALEDVVFDVYLESPALAEGWAPAQNPDLPRVFDVELVLRGLGATVPWLEFFGG